METYTEYAENRRAEIQGRYNLEMGVHLAAKEFFEELEREANDDSIPSMPPEDVKELLAVVNAEYDRLQAEKRRKRLLKRLKTIVKYATPAITAFLTMTVLALLRKMQKYKTE